MDDHKLNGESEEQTVTPRTADHSDDAPKSPGSQVDIPVVGLGGSAGALAGFETFFTLMPADTGAAFVVVQHLSPVHESLLAEVLASRTSMQVMQIRDGMQLQANCVYIIPPNHNLALRKGTLHLGAPTVEAALQMPIDLFFRSLAEDRAEKAICILFSGAGSDGALGAQAIQAAGGLVIVQDPETAQFGDIPANARAAGPVDYVLPPQRMPQAVIQYLKHPYIDSRKRAVLIEAAAKPGDIQDILAIVMAQTGCDFRWYKKATVLRRVERRMGLRHITNVAEYSSLLHQDADEVKQLLKDLLIKVTEFFRDPEAFDELRNKAIVPLLDAKSDNESLRVWIPGCASGEEAYSVAMLLIEQRAEAGKECPLQIFATDVDEAALEIARRGLFPESIAAYLDSERLRRFFSHRDEGYLINDSVRKTITFASQNVLADPPFSKMDLISCRNLLIFLDNEAQARLMALFNFALKPGGYLFLGHTETVAGQGDLFETVSHKGRISRRLTPARPFLMDSPILPERRRSLSTAAAHARPAGSNFADVLRLAILRHFGASAVLIDRKGQILQFHGQTDKYLRLPAAGPTFNVLDLAKGRLSAKLRLSIHKANLDRTTVVLDSVPITGDEVMLSVRITVTPVPQKGEVEPLLVVFFEDVAGVPAAEAELTASPESESLVKRLEDELRAVQQDLQSTIAELQSANEDLLAANEEVNSSNEELRSTNEQMLSSSEELQSTNEELTTVNSELLGKIAQLDTVNSDMANLLKSSQVAALFLDCELRIKFFTPAIARMLNLLPSDMGRPLAHLATKFVDYDLTGDALAVAQNGSEIETEVQHAEGSSYKLHIMPYYTQEGASDGVIATFSDMTRLRRAEKQLAAIVESSSDAIFSKTSDGIILTWNSAASRMYGYSAQEAIGQNVSLLVPPYRLAEVDEIMKRIRSGKRVSSFETERVAKDGRTFHVSLAVSPIKDASGRIASASVIARDITDKWESLQALKKSEERFRTLVESSPNAILLTAADGTITQLNGQAQAMFGYSPDELLRKPVEMLIPERFRSHHPAFRAQFDAEPRQRPMGAGRDLFAVRKDGSEFPVEIGLTPLQMPEGMVTMATIIDITERKRLGGSSSGSI